MAYFSSAHLNLFLHFTPVTLSSRIFDFLMVLETTFVDHLILGLLKKYRSYILLIERSDKKLLFIKNMMVTEGIEKFGLSNCVPKKVAKCWDKGRILNLREFIDFEKQD